MPIQHRISDRRIRCLTIITAALSALALLAPPTLAHDGYEPAQERHRRHPALTGSTPGLGAEPAQVRAATARYHDVDVARAAGYEAEGPCVAGPDGAMGIHYVNDDLVDLDPTMPQAQLYLPTGDGTLRLVGVEYIAPGGGELFGITFEDTVPPKPELRALHVWLWQANPAGIFAAYNPNLGCPAS